MNGSVCGWSALEELRNSMVSGLPSLSFIVEPLRLHPAESSDIADKAERRIARFGDQQAAILAGDRNRDRIVRDFPVDRRDQVAADLADQHHADAGARSRHR